MLSSSETLLKDSIHYFASKLAQVMEKIIVIKKLVLPNDISGSTFIPKVAKVTFKTSADCNKSGIGHNTKKGLLLRKNQ